MTDNELKTVNFDGLEYKIEDLTPRTIEGFNMLVKFYSPTQIESSSSAFCPPVVKYIFRWVRVATLEPSVVEQML